MTTSSDLGAFSEVRWLSVDATAPSWDQLRMNRVIEFSSRVRYDLNASDTSGIDAYGVNDTVHFTIDSNGILTDAATLQVGVYAIRVRAYDPLGHYCSAAFTVTVQDTISPAWVVTPVDQVLTAGESLDYQLQASDASGIDAWTVDDTVHFTISGTGRLTSIMTLAAGYYPLKVNVTDPYDNARSATFAVIVQAETTTTTTPTPPPIPGFPMLAATLGLVLALGMLLGMRRQRRKI